MTALFRSFRLWLAKLLIGDVNYAEDIRHNVLNITVSCAGKLVQNCRKSCGQETFYKKIRNDLNDICREVKRLR